MAGRQNTVEIIVKAKDATGGFLKSRQNVKKFADDVKKDLDTIEPHGEKVGRETGKKIEKGIVDSTKGTGDKVGKQIAAGVQKSSATKASAQKAGISFGMDFGEGAGKAIALALASPAGAAGVALGGAVVGGFAATMASAGVVGLGAFLLKDNKKVSDAWSKAMEHIGDNARLTAGVLEDEFVGLAQRTSDYWFHNLRPALHSVFIEAQPLVNKFADGIEHSLDAFMPGLLQMTHNAGPIVEGFGDFLTSVFDGAGQGLADLGSHAGDLKTTFQLVGDGIGAAIKGGIGFIGDLSAAVAENEDDFRRWGKNIGEATDAAGKDIIRLAKLFASTGGDWKSGDGKTFEENLRAFLEGGPDKFDPTRQDPDKLIAMPGVGIPEIPFLGIPKIPGVLTDKGAYDMAAVNKYQQPMLDAYAEQKKAVDQITSSMGFLNTQRDLGLQLSNDEISKTSMLLPAQEALVQANNNLSAAAGNSTAANLSNLSSLMQIAAAGYPVADALMGVVQGMSDTALAAIGATVTTDALGNSVINIPGYKPITITADAKQANPEIDGVINRIGQVQDKNVRINVTTTYSVVGDPNTGTRGVNVRSNKGGLIPGGGPDMDSVPALLTPGEFVVNRRATNANRDLLERINKAAGGSVTFDTSGGGGGYSSGSGGGGGGGTAVLEWVGGPTDDLGSLLYSYFQRRIRVRGGDSRVLP